MQVENIEEKYVKNRWIVENSIEKRKYQEEIASIASKINTLCVLPTAMGKTIIALLTVTKVLDREMNKKILFLAPTRPLVEQHKKTFEKFLKAGLNLVAITGKIKSEKRRELYNFGDIIFSTPQCIKNDINSGILSLENFSLLIVDEAQHSIGNYAYTFIASRFMEDTKQKGIILALTASPSGKYSKIKEIKENLFIKHVEIRSEYDKDIKEFIKPIEIKWVEVSLTPEMEEMKSILEEMRKNNIQRLINLGFLTKSSIKRKDLLSLQEEILKKMKEENNKILFAALSIIAEIIKIDYLIELLETQTIESLKEYVKKIFENAKIKKRGADSRIAKSFMGIIEKIEKIKTHPKIEKLKEIVSEELKNPKARIIIFAQFRSTVKTIKNEIEKIPGCKPVILIGQRGADGLKQKEQIELIKAYESGEYNTLVTTSIGEEGIHLGSATTAIFYEPVPSEIRMIQRRGRVGRERPGKIFILITKNTRDQSYYWAAYHKEKKMKKIIERMKRQRDLIDFLNEV